MMTHHIYDLEALAKNLCVDGKHPKLTERIQQCADVGSAHQDISQAIESLEALSVLSGSNADQKMAPDLLGTVAGSLMLSAIVFYARATDTAPVANERRKWFGIGKLDFDSQKTHKEILTLRNKQVAHFGRSLAIDGELTIEETTVFRPNDPNHPIGFVSARVHNKAAMSGRFAALTLKVRELAERAAGKAFERVRNALIAACAEDPSLTDRIKLFPIRSAKLISIETKPDGIWTVGSDVQRYSGNVTRRKAGTPTPH